MKNGAHEVEIAHVFAPARCKISVQMMCNRYMFCQVMYERSETCQECLTSLFCLVSKVRTCADYPLCCYTGSSVGVQKTTPNIYISSLQRLHNGMMEAIFSDYVGRSTGAKSTLAGLAVRHAACSPQWRKSRCRWRFDLHHCKSK